MTLNFGSILDGNNTGYNWNATSIKRNAIVKEEKTKAFEYFFLDTNLGTLAIASKANTGSTKDIGCSLNLSETPSTKSKVYKDIIEKLIIKKSIPFFSKKVNLACKRPSVFSNKNYLRPVEKNVFKEISTNKLEQTLNNALKYKAKRKKSDIIKEVIENFK